jgi:hypothetical protein
MLKMHSPIGDVNMQIHYAFFINHANSNMDARFAAGWAQPYKGFLKEKITGLNLSILAP